MARKSSGTIDLTKAREIAFLRTSIFQKMIRERQRKEIQVIVRDVKKRGFKVKRKIHRWIFTAKSGEKISLPAGYYAVVKGILGRIAPLE